MSDSSSEEKINPVYELFALILCVFALCSLAVQNISQPSVEVFKILIYADYFTCSLFFVDFLASLYFARNRRAYFLKWGWIDLLSSIPAIEPMRWGRAARILRVLRVLRGLRATKIIASAILRRRSQSAFLAVCLVSFLLIVFSSIAVLHVEAGASGANIASADDAVWWSVVTITTVGYGDRFPVTAEARLIGAILMITGVGLFGTLSGFVASWFLQGQQNNQSEIDSLRKDIELLIKELKISKGQTGTG